MFNNKRNDDKEHRIVIERTKFKMSISIDGEKLNTRFMDYHPDGIVYKILNHFGIKADVEYIEDID
jgi:hypothetical protein